MKKLSNCHFCRARPGEMHQRNCDVERCSVCGEQYISCSCEGHDPTFARWMGIWPGEAEANYLAIDLNELYAKGYDKIFFVKPREKT